MTAILEGRSAHARLATSWESDRDHIAVSVAYPPGVGILALLGLILALIGGGLVVMSGPGSFDVVSGCLVCVGAAIFAGTLLLLLLRRHLTLRPLMRRLASAIVGSCTVLVLVLGLAGASVFAQISRPPADVLARGLTSGAQFGSGLLLFGLLYAWSVVAPRLAERTDAQSR